MIVFPRIEVHAVDHCTLSCIGCNHGSHLLKNKSYCAEDYIPWLDLLKSKGHNWDWLVVSGGEPFMLKDGLNVFCSTLKKRYGSFIELFTNAFWLSGPEVIETYKQTFESINRIMFSFYKPYTDKYGFDNMQNLVNQIRDRFNLQTGAFQPSGVSGFGQVMFSEEPNPNPKKLCPVKDCSQLTKEGIIYRCTYGHYLKTSVVTDGFKCSKDIKFDLNTDLDTRDIIEWRKKWPLDSCSYCGCGEDIIWLKWKSDPKTKNMSKEEYRKTIQEMMRKEKLFL